MPSNNLVGLDSQCLSYVIDAMHGVQKPTDYFAEEKISLLRIFFYTSYTFTVSPTVLDEVAKIRSSTRRVLHDNYVSVLFFDPPVSNPNVVTIRIDDFIHLHNQVNDCRILAEAEDLGLDILLTYDKDFLRRLKSFSNTVHLIKPSTYWYSLGIPKGAEPVKTPRKTNPLSKEYWWQW